MGLKFIASFDHIIADEQNSFEKKIPVTHGLLDSKEYQSCE
jgi:hypothetical protein